MAKKGRKKTPEEEVMATRRRVADLLAYVRSRIGDSDQHALLNYLNRNLPESKQFAAETLGRWERLEQTILAPNISKLAKAIEVNEHDLKQYIKGGLSSDRIFRAIDEAEVPVDDAQAAGEILRLMRKLSPMTLVDVMNRAWDILQERLKSAIAPTPIQTAESVRTIAQVVQSCRVECAEMFEDIIPDPEGRVSAIAQGARPTDEELELISQVSGIPLDDLWHMRKEEFGNGANGTANRGCYSNR